MARRQRSCSDGNPAFAGGEMGYHSQNVQGAKFVLTAGKSLMYYPQVGISFLLFGKYGRLLKLVDRTDLGSVGDEP